MGDTKSALRPFLIEYFSGLGDVHFSAAHEAAVQAGLPYKASTVKSRLVDDKKYFEWVSPGTYRLRDEFRRIPPTAPIAQLPSTDCEKCGQSMMSSCVCLLPTDVVMGALRAALTEVGGSTLHPTSLLVALLTDALLERGCEIASVRRAPEGSF